MPHTAAERHAELVQKIDGIQTLLEKVQQNQIAIGRVEERLDAHNTRLDAHRDDIGKVEGRVNNWGGVNSGLAVIAGVIGFFFGPKQ